MLAMLTTACCLNVSIASIVENTLSNAFCNVATSTIAVEACWWICRSAA